MEHENSRKRTRKNRKGKGKFLSFLPASFVVTGLILFTFAILVATGTTAYAINLENHDQFCASCHTQPETTYYQHTLDQNATTLADFHSQKDVRCIDCHSGSGAFGRAVGLTQGMQDLLAYYSGHYHNPAITTNKLSDSSCIKCHTDIMSNQSFNNHFHLFLSQWQAIDPNAAGCVDCHTSHTTGTADIGFLQQDTVTTQCQNCHNIAGERD